MHTMRNALRAGGLLLAMLLAACAGPRQPALLLDTAAAPSTAIAPAGPFVNAHAIIILRHADIDPAQKARLGNQTPLLPRGEKRADEIVTALRDAGVTRIITSRALRTEETAAPLAKELHIAPEEPFGHGAEQAKGPGAMPAPDEAQGVFDFLVQSAKPADTILLVEHHSLIPGLMADFGFKNEPKFDDATEFDRVYLLLPDAQHHAYQLFRLRFGGDWGALNAK